MFEIAAVIVCVLIMCSAFILLAVLLVVGAGQWIVGLPPKKFSAVLDAAD